MPVMFNADSASHNIIRHWKPIIACGVVFLVLAVGASFLFPLQYRADAQVLIIARAQEGVDPYTTAKSTERIGENIAQLIKTDDFFKKIISLPDSKLDLSKFDNVSDRIRRKRWDKTADASVVFGTGLLNINAYHENKEQAKLFATAVANALIKYGNEYVGSDVAMKVVNLPVVTLFPVRPNLAVNALAGLILGMMIGVFLVIRRK